MAAAVLRWSALTDAGLIRFSPVPACTCCAVGGLLLPPTYCRAATMTAVVLDWYVGYFWYSAGNDSVLNPGGRMTYLLAPVPVVGAPGLPMTLVLQARHMHVWLQGCLSWSAQEVQHNRIQTTHGSAVHTTPVPASRR